MVSGAVGVSSWGEACKNAGGAATTSAECPFAVHAASQSSLPRATLPSMHMRVCSHTHIPSTHPHAHTRTHKQSCLRARLLPCPRLAPPLKAHKVNTSPRARLRVPAQVEPASHEILGAAVEGVSVLPLGARLHYLARLWPVISRTRDAPVRLRLFTTAWAAAIQSLRSPGACVRSCAYSVAWLLGRVSCSGGRGFCCLSQALFL